MNLRSSIQIFILLPSWTLPPPSPKQCGLVTKMNFQWLKEKTEGGGGSNKDNKHITYENHYQGLYLPVFFKHVLRIPRDSELAHLESAQKDRRKVVTDDVIAPLPRQPSSCNAASLSCTWSTALRTTDLEETHQLLMPTGTNASTRPIKRHMGSRREINHGCGTSAPPPPPPPIFSFLSENPKIPAEIRIRHWSRARNMPRGSVLI